jgi:hypothetical protein
MNGTIRSQSNRRANCSSTLFPKSHQKGMLDRAIACLNYVSAVLLALQQIHEWRKGQEEADD